MATRTNASEERLATLRSVMNVIALLDQSGGHRAGEGSGIDLRPLLPKVENIDSDESWDDFRFPVPGRSRVNRDCR